MRKYLVALLVLVLAICFYYVNDNDTDYENATLQYLSDIKLLKLDGSNESFEAWKLWQDQGAVIMVVRRPGCILCREEAADLSKLKQEFKENNFSLIAVVHEEIGVPEFRDYFKGDIYLDQQRRFFGPKERWMSLSGLLRPSVWFSLIRAKVKQMSGNLEGEGRLLGGLFVIGPKNKGILFEHRESEFGDHANHDLIIEAIKKN